MSCYECGSNNLEKEMNESTGNWFICCKECEWAELFELYKADNEPENQSGNWWTKGELGGKTPNSFFFIFNGVVSKYTTIWCYLWDTLLVV